MENMRSMYTALYHAIRCYGPDVFQRTPMFWTDDRVHAARAAYTSYIVRRDRDILGEYHRRRVDWKRRYGHVPKVLKIKWR